MEKNSYFPPAQGVITSISPPPKLRPVVKIFIRVHIMHLKSYKTFTRPSICESFLFGFAITIRFKGQGITLLL